MNKDHLVILLLALLCFVSVSGQAQDSDVQKLSAAEIEQSVASIALYPDELLSQVLIASTYPLEVVQADRWVQEHPGESATSQSWDESIKALTQTPDVLHTMSENLDWTQKLGDAVLAQQDDVMDAVQRLRAKAYAENNLKSTDQQNVRVEPATGENTQQVIVIESATPNTVYVPYYEPTVIYGSWPYPAYPPYYYPPPPGYAFMGGIAFGAGMVIASEIWDDGFDWGHNDIDIDIDHNTNINNIDRDKRPGGGGSGTKWKHDPAHRHGVAYKNDQLNKKFAPERVANRGNSEKMHQDFRGRLDQSSGQLGQRSADMRNRDIGAAHNAQRTPSQNRQQPHSTQRQRNDAFSDVSSNRQARSESNRGRSSVNRSSGSRNVGASQRSRQHSRPSGGGGGGRRR
jgi:hypothetical protein